MLHKHIHVLPFGIITTSYRLRIHYANSFAEDTLGMSLPLLKKYRLQDLFHPHDRLVALAEKVLESNASVKEYDFPLSGPRIGEKLATLHLMPLEEELLLCFDVTDHSRTLSHSIAQNQQAVMQSNMASILAHEVKNPLAGIRGAAQLLQKNMREEDKKLTSIICQETDRIARVIEEVEFFATSTQLKTEPVNIHEVLHYARAVTENSGPHGVSFVEKFDPSLPEIPGNRDWLVQCFVNLFKNAIEATPQHCVLKLATAYQGGMRLKSGKTPLPIVISVEDNGPGIPPPLRETLFDPFVTSKKNGKGLGLAIVSKIITDHGGVIELSPHTNKGTRFQVMLPAA